jgi:hypothetical protein
MISSIRPSLSAGRCLAQRSFQTLLPPRSPNFSSVNLARRFYMVDPMTPQEEQDEKNRVASLTPFQKEMELRELDKQLAKLNMLRGIASGELYTWRGKFKALARDYGMPFMMWYWTCWCATAGITYGAIELGGLDAMEVIGHFDALTGFKMADKVDPTVGTIGLTLVFNELIEPLRLPIVIMTTKPVVNFLNPPKY